MTEVLQRKVLSVADKELPTSENIADLSGSFKRGLIDFWAHDQYRNDPSWGDETIVNPCIVENFLNWGLPREERLYNLDDSEKWIRVVSLQEEIWKNWHRSNIMICEICKVLGRYFLEDYNELQRYYVKAPLGLHTLGSFGIVHKRRPTIKSIKRNNLFWESLSSSGFVGMPEDVLIDEYRHRYSPNKISELDLLVAGRIPRLYKLRYANGLWSPEELDYNKDTSWEFGQDLFGFRRYG